MYEFAFLDETLDINTTQSYHLSIQVSLNGFSFSILDTVRNKYVALKNYPLDKQKGIPEDQLRDIFKKDEFLTRKYKSSSYFYITDKSTLVPSPLFNKDKIKEYLMFNHPLEEHNKIFYNQIKNAGTYTVYSIPVNICEILDKQFPGIKNYHQSVPFIEQILLKNQPGEFDFSAFINVTPGIFDIAVSQSKKLILYNQFRFRNENDFIYFVLNIFEQLKLSPEKTLLLLSGEITKTSKYYESLKKYIKSIRFEKRDNQFTYSYTFNQIAEHTFIPLQNLYSCG
ncbi:MAG: DUF3822 family protein [Bacteroidales bacterium]|nr:DUF3822 family protein [Bacteroidales bacterium]